MFHPTFSKCSYSPLFLPLSVLPSLLPFPPSIPPSLPPPPSLLPSLPPSLPSLSLSPSLPPSLPPSLSISPPSSLPPYDPPSLPPFLTHSLSPSLHLSLSPYHYTTSLPSSSPSLSTLHSAKVLSFAAFVSACAATADLEGSGAANYRSAAGWAIFIAIVVFIVEGVVITVRFLNFSVVNNYSFIFLIIVS